MKRYLDLIPIHARVHRRENHMTRLCIILAVFLVTAICSMAEMAVRMEQNRLTEKHGAVSAANLLNSSMGQSVLPVAALLFLLVMTAGIFMISGSMNSSVSQRVRFFGMLRCLGMSRQQVIRFVRLEALGWCRTAVPTGIGIGVLTTWGLCAVLHFIVGEEFSEIPLFSVSPFGIVCGILVGVITVFLAAGAPAKRASRVSPIAAVSGNADTEHMLRRPTHTGICRIEYALGAEHAVSHRKNPVLMTGSFALSIVLFLSFSVMIDFVEHLIPQSAAASDIDLSAADGHTIPSELADRLRAVDGVKRVYGRRSTFDVSIRSGENRYLPDTADVISYDDFDLDSLKKDHALKKGSRSSKVYGDSSYVLATSDMNCPWNIGDTVRIGDETLTIAGLLKNDPFSENGLTGGRLTLITSGETYVRLTGENDYSLLMLQTTADATDRTLQEIEKLAGDACHVQDKRDQRTSGTYRAFVFCVYAFLAMIALVTLLHIINSISMSASARTRQYQTMRAVGMDDRQLTKMIAGEAFTYAALGCITGCGIGLPLCRLLYTVLITSHFLYAVWQPPLGELTVIGLFMLLATAAAVYAPAKRLRSLPVTAELSEQ